MPLSAGQTTRPRTAHEYVRRALRTAILEGELAGGARLVQSELATQLQVSTTPVREALRDLATEGLVFLDPHRGAVVRPLDLEEVREIYELRMLLEPVMVRRVVGRLDTGALDRAAELQQRMNAEQDPMAWVELNRAFHAVFAEPDVGSRLGRMMSGLQDTASAYVGLSLKARPDRMAEANCDHRRLIAVYRDHDEEAAVAETLHHLRGTLATIEDAGF